MLEIRYIKTTKELTGWCGDEHQIGNLDRDRSEEAITILDIPVPPLGLKAYLCDGETLVDNPDYIPPEPPRQFAEEIDTLADRISSLEMAKI